MSHPAGPELEDNVARKVPTSGFFTRALKGAGNATGLRTPSSAAKAPVDSPAPSSRPAVTKPVSGDADYRPKSLGHKFLSNAGRLLSGEAPKFNTVQDDPNATTFDPSDKSTYHLATTSEKAKMALGMDVSTSVADQAKGVAGKGTAAVLAFADSLPHAPDYDPQLAAGAPAQLKQDGVTKPGQAMSDRAMNAEGSTEDVRAAQARLAAAESFHESAHSTAATVASGGLKLATGVDAQEIASHGANAVRIQALNTIYNDPSRQANYHMSRAMDMGASDSLHEAVSAYKDNDDPAAKKARARAAIGAAGRKVSKNLKLAAATRAVGKQSENVSEWKVKNTVGKEVPAGTSDADASVLGRVGGLDGHDSVSAEKTERTWGGAIAQGIRTGASGLTEASEVLGGSSASADAAIAEGRLGKAAAVTGSGVLQQGAAIGVAATGLGAAVTGGISTAATVGGLVGKGFGAAADYAAQGQDQRDRQRELTTGERQKQVRGTAINFGGAETEYEPTVKEQIGGALRDKLRAGALAANDALGIQSPAAVPAVAHGGATPGDPTPAAVTHADVTPADVTPADVTPAKVTPAAPAPVPAPDPVPATRAGDSIRAFADSLPHAPDYDPQLDAGASVGTPKQDGKTLPGKAMRDRAAKAAGSTDSIRAAQSRLQTAESFNEGAQSTAATVASAAIGHATGVNVQEIASTGANAVRIQALHSIYNDPTRQGALHLARAADMGASDALHDSVTSFKSETDPKARQAKAKSAFRAAGTRVAKNLTLGAATEAAGEQSTNAEEWSKKQTGTLDSGDNVDASKMERTRLGALAQGVRTGATALAEGSEVLGGSSADADLAIKQGRLAKATAITGAGVVKNSAGVATAVTGLGGAVTGGISTAATVGGLLGKGVGAAADYAAQGQDQRDRQRELTTGARRENIRGKAINFKGAESDYEPTVAEMAGGAVRDKMRAGADGIDSAQQTASSWGSRISSFASRAWQGTKKLATRGLKAFTGLFGR